MVDKNCQDIAKAMDETWWERAPVVYADDGTGFGGDSFNPLATRASSLPSIFPHGTGGPQLLAAAQDYDGLPADGARGTGRGRKKLRFKKSKLKQLCDVDVLPVEYLGPKIEYSVNLPRVTAQLEKLMGTNVVRLTDRKYMQELQRRIQEDYNVTLEKRISEREHEECQRQRQLALDGKTLHPVQADAGAEAKEIEREKNLILSGAGDNIAEEVTSSTFLANHKTNANALNKREKLKTIREKNAERLIKQGHRWERERLQMEEQSRQLEIARRTKREALLEEEKLYMIEENDRSLNLLRMKTKKGPCRDMHLRTLLMQQREELGRTIQKRDFDMKDEMMADVEGKSDKRRRRKKLLSGVVRRVQASDYQVSPSPEEGYISMNNAESPDDLETSIAIKGKKGSKDSGDESEIEEDAAAAAAAAAASAAESKAAVAAPEETEADLADTEEARLKEELDRSLLEKKKARNVRNEDPKITKLKDADTVADIYTVADEIIVLEKKKTKKGFGK